MEIDRLFRQRRRHSSSPARSPRVDHAALRSPDIAPDRRGRMPGIWDGSMNTTKNAKHQTEENRQTSSLKANGLPMKMLIKAELSKDGKARHNSPGLIARLMGLDSLPASEPFRVCEPGVCSQKSLNKDCSQSLLSAEPECKDVFEVVETVIGKNDARPTYQTIPKCSKIDTGKDFKGGKFPSRKCQSCNCNNQAKPFKEPHDVSEMLGTKEDLFLRLLQEPNSLLARHFVDLDSVLSSPESTHITVLKSSKPKKAENGELYWESDKKYERYSRGRLSGGTYREKCDSALCAQLTTYQAANASPQLARPKVGRKSESSTCSLPTRIVVLKPNLGKISNAHDFLPSQNSNEGSRPGHRRHKSSGSCNFLSENREHQKLIHSNEVPVHKVHCSGEGSKQLLKTGRKSRRKDSFKGGADSGWRQMKSYSADKAVVYGNLDSSGDLERGHMPSSSHSAESFVSREARRHLCRKWSMSNCHEGVGYVGQGPSTLAEMLALSDGETYVSNLLDVHPTECFPLGISSRDGWKDIQPVKLARSRSLPSSSTFLESSNSSDGEGACNSVECQMLKDVVNIPLGISAEELNQRQKLDASPGNEKMPLLLDALGGLESELSICKIGETSDTIFATEVGLSFSEPSVSFYDAVASADDTLSPDENANENSTAEAIVDGLLQDGAGGDCTGHIRSNQDDAIFLSKIKVPEIVELDPFIKANTWKTDLLPAPKETEQPSPVSVLDSLDEDGKSKPGCFQRVNAELQSLRLQLQLLRSDSASICSEESETFIDEDINCDTVDENQNIPQFCICEEDRDFTYVLRILTDSGFEGATTDDILDACYRPEFPIDAVVFTKLEKLYESSAWLRGERKLLFDLVNCILSEVLASKKGLLPWVQPDKVFGTIPDRKVLAEDVWGSLVRRRLGSKCNLARSFLDESWLKIADDIDSVSKDVETMVRDDLLDEIVSEFIIR